MDKHSNLKNISLPSSYSKKSDVRNSNHRLKKNSFSNLTFDHKDYLTIQLEFQVKKLMEDQKELKLKRKILAERAEINPDERISALLKQLQSEKEKINDLTSHINKIRTEIGELDEEIYKSSVRLDERQSQVRELDKTKRTLTDIEQKLHNQRDEREKILRSLLEYRNRFALLEMQKWHTEEKPLLKAKLNSIRSEKIDIISQIDRLKRRKTRFETDKLLLNVLYERWHDNVGFLPSTDRNLPELLDLYHTKAGESNSVSEKLLLSLQELMESNIQKQIQINKERKYNMRKIKHFLQDKEVIRSQISKTHEKILQEERKIIQNVNDLIS